MSKYTFMCEDWNQFGTIERTAKVTFEGTSLHDMLEQFEMFLKGQGFVFDGVIDVVPLDDGHSDNENEDWSDNPFFSTDDNNIIVGGAAAQPSYSIESEDITLDLNIQGAEDLYGDVQVDTHISTAQASCPICKLTRDQLGDAICFDQDCGLRGKDF